MFDAFPVISTQTLGDRTPIQAMADYIDNNSCHIDQTADVIDEVDILGTYTTMQEHQNDEIIASPSIDVSAGAACDHLRRAGEHCFYCFTLYCGAGYRLS